MRALGTVALALAALLVAACASGAEGPFEKAGENLCKGGDFEGGALAQHYKWNNNRNTFSAKDGAGKGGGKAAALVSTGTKDRGKFYHKGFQVPTGADIRVTLWVKCEGHVGGTWVNYEGSAGEGFAKFHLAGGTHDWIKYTHRTTVPKKGPASARIELWFYVYGKGKVLIDDIECRVITRDVEAAGKLADETTARARADSIRNDRMAHLGILATDGSRRVFRDQPFLGSWQKSVALDICRHEFEGAQLLISAYEQDVTDVEISVSDLKGPGTIESKNVQVLPVAYCDRSSAPPVKWYDGQTSKWWPEPLLPNRKFKVQKGTVQPVYLRFYCPKDAKAGDYTGAVEVKSSAGTAKVPVKLTVHDVAMPTRLHFKTMLVGGKSDKPYLDLALQQRIPIGNLYAGMSWTNPRFPAKGNSFDFTEIEKKLQYAIDRGLNSFIMASTPKSGKWGFPKSYSAGWKQKMTKVIREYGKFLKSKGWFDMAYYNNIDEPSKGRWNQCKDMYRMAKAADPEVKVYHCVNTVGALDALKGFADTWDVYVQQSDQQQAEARKAEGNEIWWAICIWPREHPNLFVEYPLVDARVVGWSAFKYGVAGFEYWQMTSWEKQNPKDASWITCPDGVLTTSWKFTKRQSGDGYLAYPGPGGKPVNSLRLEALRDGFEDNELLWQLKAKLPELTGDQKAEAEKLLAGGDGLVTNMFIYSQDPSDYIARRRRVLELLTGRKASAGASSTGAAPKPAGPPSRADERAAARLLSMARRAERIGQRETATGFYRQVVEKYPGTKAARRAKDRLE